jgi:amino-acid N-acetyltransferase
MRITDEVALDSAQEAAGQLRYEIEAAFSQGLPNTPMAGSTVRVISGNFITARPVGILDGVDFKHSGLVRKVDVAGIRRCWTSAPWCCCRPSASRPPARPST